jgi:hypothetical protein
MHAEIDRRSAGAWRRERTPDLQGATVVGRQSFADEPVGPTVPSEKDFRPTRKYPYSRYENARAGGSPGGRK